MNIKFDEVVPGAKLLRFCIDFIVLSAVALSMMRDWVYFFMFGWKVFDSLLLCIFLAHVWPVLLIYCYFVVIFNKSGFQINLEPAYLVGMTGFEPATSASRTQRATNCATSRKFVTKLIIATKACFGKCFFKFTSYFVFKYHSSCLILFFDHWPGGCRAGKYCRAFPPALKQPAVDQNQFRAETGFFRAKIARKMNKATTQSTMDRR